MLALYIGMLFVFFIVALIMTGVTCWEYLAYPDDSNARALLWSVGATLLCWAWPVVVLELAVYGAVLVGIAVTDAIKQVRA